MTAMLVIGNNPEVIKTAAAAIVSVVKACDTDAKAVAACAALQDLARSPSHTTISSCSFVSGPARRKPKK